MSSWSNISLSDVFMDRRAKTRTEFTPMLGVPDDGGVAGGFTLAQNKLLKAQGAVHQIKDMYAAKSAEGSKEQPRDISKEAEIAKLIQEGRIKAWLQPKRDAKTEEIMGFEVLCRMESDQGLLQPGQFIPHIRDEQKKIFEWAVIDQALSLLSEANLPDGIRMGVNVSASTLSDKDFFAQLTEKAKAKGAELGNLRIEILESEPIIERQKVSDLIAKCAEAGIDFSLDDFCADESKPEDLKDFAVKEVKLDRDLVWMLGGADTKRAEKMIQGVVTWAAARGAKVTAEGVENELQAQMLLDMGINCQQGYHWNKPMPAQEALSLLNGEINTPNIGMTTAPPPPSRDGPTSRALRA